MYALKRMVIGNAPLVELTEREYLALCAAQKGLVEALYVEQKLALLVANFEELEADILRLALHTSLYNRTEWSDEIEELTRLNRRMLNFLSSARLYVDQVKHHFSVLFGPDSEEAGELTACLSREYDARLGYRVMEALRNYSQHRGWPVHVVNRRTSRVEETESTRAHIRHTATLHIDVDRLKADGGFKAKILAELSETHPAPDLKLLARSYLAGLGAVHLAARQILAADVKEWEEAVLAALDRFRVEAVPDNRLVAAVKLDGARVIERTDLFADIIVHRQRLAGVYAHLTHFGESVVSGY